jgi:hypothetical protein
MKRGRPPKQRPEQIQTTMRDEAPTRVTIKGCVEPDDITEEQIKAIEADLITARGHWGVIDPRRVAAACVNVMRHH